MCLRMKNNDIYELCKLNFDLIHDAIQKIDQKQTLLEQRLTELANRATTGGASTAFQHIENKVTYLNEHISPFASCFLGIFDETLNASHEHVLRVFQQNVTIYQCAAELICQHVKHLNSTQQKHLLYAFPFQKNIIYFWNHLDHTWEKMSQSTTKALFEKIQKILIAQYLKSSEENSSLFSHLDLIECFTYLYTDNFDAKFMEFKKLIFQGLT